MTQTATYELTFDRDAFLDDLDMEEVETYEVLDYEEALPDGWPENDVHPLQRLLEYGVPTVGGDGGWFSSAGQPVEVRVIGLYLAVGRVLVCPLSELPFAPEMTPEQMAEVIEQVLVAKARDALDTDTAALAAARGI